MMVPAGKPRAEGPANRWTDARWTGTEGMDTIAPAPQALRIVQL